jgi:hypothetical protein
MRLFHSVSLLTLYLILSSSGMASQGAQTSQAASQRLTNVDVLYMLNVGLSQEIVIAKIRASTCEFDTSPAALKALKAANVPDAVILAMVQAPNGVLQAQDTTNKVSCGYLGISIQDVNPDLAKAFKLPSAKGVLIGDATAEGPGVKAGLQKGDVIVSLNGQPTATAQDLCLRISQTPPGTAVNLEAYRDGQKMQFSTTLMKLPDVSTPTQIDLSGHDQSKNNKQEEIQKASNDLEDCRVRSQNEYNSKMGVLSTMKTLSPMMQVAATSKLKQNLDEELRQCRSQYQLRLNAIKTNEK